MTLAIAASSNVPSIETLLDTARELGALEGMGTNSRPEFAMAVVDAVEAGQYDTASNEMTKKVWTEFVQARNNAAHDKSAGTPEKVQKSLTQQVSKLFAIAKAATNGKGNGPDVLRRARHLVNGHPAIKLSTFDAIVAVARAVQKSDVALTDKQIIDACLPADKQEQTDAERELAVLEEVYKKLDKLMAGTEATDTTEGKAPRPSHEVKAAMEYIDARCQALKVEIKLDEIERIKAGRK
jgi:hypothetical protein